MPTALFSVSNKIGIVEFAKELKFLGWDIISSGGTAKTLKENFIENVEVSEIIEFPEILDGRVKTLSPKIYGGILAIRSNKKHLKQLREHNIKTIDMVVVNLYPFDEVTVGIPKPKNRNIDQNVIENIDVGGVSLLRAAAKNYKDVIVVCDLDDYEVIIKELKNNSITQELRLTLSAKAFRHTAYYDSLISTYLTYEKFPTQSVIPLKKLSCLRYGENPHQKAALYSTVLERDKSIIVSAKQLHGKRLSYNNYLDLEAACNLVCEFGNPMCAIVKHNNPSGCAEGSNVKDAYLKAFSCDPLSAFGGILAFNKDVDEAVALEINKIFVECVIAPSYSKEAMNILMKKKNIILLKQNISHKKEKNVIEYRMLSYGMLVQDRDDQLLSEVKLMTKRSPFQREKDALDFAWKVAKYVKSNAVVLVRERQTVGIGAGQMSRIDSLKIAVEKMKRVKHNFDEKLFPLVLASDAFFPFPDVIEEAFRVGVTAIIQPGGSIKDDESIRVANDKNIAMISTGMRHFRH
ncbi:MAG: bifunctional phosphoribosylaminoimidazolecarboxamide formyltransferase/IMP cyclohydrolase [Endomicrobium sp.]|jgi:phosphoribosylaminoimidazolecarboxamide formyltransferase/IMP cyclohydrolase|nr:bifunctional phosphoribosylaminoimidazolecarboxamide formyltransferase/IMP cyclohydrolase [Endomicrobium sp.]